MPYKKKRTGEFSKRAQLEIFPSTFFKFRTFGKLHPPKPVVLQIFTKNKLFNFSKRPLRVSTTCNKWLKEALVITLALFYCFIEG